MTLNWPCFFLLLLAAASVAAGGSPASALKNRETFQTASGDARGRKVRLQKAPERIASGTVAGDELLWLILKEAGRTGKLVAVSTLSDSARYSHLEEESKKIPGRVGGSLEHLLAVRPDLVVLANFNRPELISKIEAMGMPVWVLRSFNSLSDISRAILVLGALIHEEKAAEQVHLRFQNEIKNLQRSPVKRARILGLNQDKSAWGPDTLFDDLVNLAGGQNCLKGESLKGWPKLSPEFLVSLNPDWIVMSGEPSQKDAMLRNLRSWPELKGWKALQQEKLILISGRDLHAASPWILEAGKVLKRFLAAP